MSGEGETGGVARRPLGASPSPRNLDDGSGIEGGERGRARARLDEAPAPVLSAVRGPRRYSPCAGPRYAWVSVARAGKFWRNEECVSLFNDLSVS